MGTFQLRHKFEDYTEAEFLALVETICSAEGGEKYQDALITNFDIVSEHPESTDLIFYPEDPDITSKGIVDQIKAWRQANDKPLFKTS
ncbi:bacteriocin immunity protein [Nissabacter archeti]|uniref:Bacteriocin immunity protein n=1 Tax=Nissabacter archeti TaxID=1917880 RepID=A0ABS5JKA0_9GAMM|nr:bacteriocin immunity protein [Nissabacter archeti]MBS0970409.1 bacteriocin immunity protein [Nissabacter archeti]